MPGKVSGSGGAANAVCIGVFDGVHLGHQKILRLAARAAKESGGEAIGITFDPHPVNVLAGKRRVPMIFSIQHRLRHMAECGVKRVRVMRFTKSFARTEPEVFVRDILVRGLRARTVIVGEGFRFGRGARGDTKFLRASGKRLGFRVKVVKPVHASGGPVSSTRIRHLIERGMLREASALSGRPVSLYGVVIHGKSRGRKLGAPTLNLKLDHETLPPAGVYAARAICGDATHAAVMHLGPRPTFGEKTPTVEVHLIGVHASLYGTSVEIFVLQRIRSIRRFRNPTELRIQIQKDIDRSLEILQKLRFVGS